MQLHPHHTPTQHIEFPPPRLTFGRQHGSTITRTPTHANSPPSLVSHLQQHIMVSSTLTTSPNC